MIFITYGLRFVSNISNGASVYDSTFLVISIKSVNKISNKTNKEREFILDFILFYTNNKMQTSPYINTRIVYSILFYILLIVLIVLTKPSIIFEPNDNLKPFGIGEDKTMFSFGVFTVVLAILSFYVFCLIDLVFTKNI